MSVGMIIPPVASIDPTLKAIVALLIIDIAIRAGIMACKADGEHDVLIAANVVTFDAGLAFAVFALEGAVAGFLGGFDGVLFIAPILNSS
jgi:hypothetical protein